jgi:hypothetical protein
MFEGLNIKDQITGTQYKLIPRSPLAFEFMASPAARGKQKSGK